MVEPTSQPRRPSAGRVALGLAAIILAALGQPALGQPAQPGGPTAGKESAAPKNGSTAEKSAADELALKQSEVADKYARLETLLAKLAELEASGNPRRSALLKRALSQSKEKLTQAQLETVVKLLHQKQLKRALDGQGAAQADLQSLLALLQSEDRGDRLKSEQARIKEYIQEVEKMIRLQKSLQGQTENNADAKKLAQDQANLADRAGGLAKKIKDTEENGGPAQKPSDPKPPVDGDPKPGDVKPGAEPKNNHSDKPKENPGDKPKEKSAEKPGEPPADAPKNDPPPPGGQSGEMPPDKSQPGKPPPGKPNPGKPKDGAPAEPNQDQNQPPPSAPPDHPARKRIEQAEQKMRDAQNKLEAAKRKESAEDQRQAKEELEKAKAELEQILRQMREEEIERTLAALESRFKKMLEMQLRVYEGTRRLDQLPAEKRGDPFVVESGKLAFSERKIAVEAQKALLLLKEEGSSVAFPATVEQLQDDLNSAAERLADAKVDETVLGYEEDAIAALEELIESLQQAQQELEKKKQREQQQQQPSQPQDEPLVDKIAELKMIKSLQERVNKRTTRFARLLHDEQDPVGQVAAELVDALKKLAERERELFRITRDLVLGKNQ